MVSKEDPADDILVASNNLVDHINELAELFIHLEMFGLHVNFGYTLTSEGIKLQTARNKTLAELLETTNNKNMDVMMEFSLFTDNLALTTHIKLNSYNS